MKGSAPRTAAFAGCVLASLIGPASPLFGQDPGDPLPPRRGPLEVREEFLPALPRLTLAARAADALPSGRTLVRLDLDWGSDFAGRAGYFIDGEHRTLALSARRGVGRGLTAGARLPLRYRGGGVLDALIDAVHGLGFPDGGRSLAPRGQLVLAARGPDGSLIEWQGEAGTGLGKLELEAQWSPRADAATGAARFALAGRVALPTGTGAFAGGGVEGALQVLGAAPLGRRVDLHAGLGGVVADQASFEGLTYERVRGYGFVALEWRVGRAWSLLAQADGASRLLTGIDTYPGLQSYLRLGVKRDVGRDWVLEGGFSENITEQQATTDAGFWLGASRRF